MEKRSRSSVVARIEVRSNVIALDLAAVRIRQISDGPLTGDGPVVGHAATVNPHGDSGLFDGLTCELGELGGKSDLPSRDTEQLCKPINQQIRGLSMHGGTENNTSGVIVATTSSVIPFPQTPPMARNGGKTSEFWLRLTEARTTRKRGPLSMLQTDIAKEYSVRQSAVTKWKTGGEKGTTKPEPDLVERMAEDADCAFEWLWWGRGPMRPNVPLDPVTQQVVEAMSKLDTIEHKRAVLVAALAQQQLQRPEVAARVKQAEKEAERQIRNAARKSS
jgi:hypothetical protein